MKMTSSSTEAVRPAVSILMPVYNNAPYLQAAIDSILSQTFGDFELLLIDDGSTDSSWSIIQSTAEKDKRVVPIRLNHVGLARALNEGLKIARADLFARMDGDDLCMPDRLEKQFRYLQQHPAIQFVGAGYELLFNDQPTENTHIPPCGPANIQKEIEHSCCVTLVMGNRHIMLDLGGYRPHLFPAEDYDMWLRVLSKYPLSIDNIAEPLFQYRVHDAQVSSQRAFKQIICTEAALIAYHAREAGLPDPFQDAQEITYERLCAHAADIQKLNRMIVNGYSGRIVQQYNRHATKENLYPLYEGMRSFAKEHGLRCYAKAMLNIVMARQSRLSPLRRFVCLLRAVSVGALSPAFQQEVFRRLFKHRAR